MNNQNAKHEKTSFEERLVNLERKVLELETTIRGGQNLALKSGTVAPKKLSLKEFLKEKMPRNTRETTVAVAYYLEQYERVIPFNGQDLERGFRSAKIPPPKNINDMVNKNIRAGLLMEAADKKDGRKAWELTATGEHVVDDGFHH